MTAAKAFESISGSGDDLQQVVAVCDALRDYCLIGGLAINCYVEPVYTMDADFALAAAHLDSVKERLSALGFKVEDHPHSLNALRPGSQLSIQFTKDARYADFPARAEVRETLGLRLRVADVHDHALRVRPSRAARGHRSLWFPSSANRHRLAACS